MSILIGYFLTELLESISDDGADGDNAPSPGEHVGDLPKHDPGKSINDFSSPGMDTGVPLPPFNMHVGVAPRMPWTGTSGTDRIEDNLNHNKLWGMGGDDLLFGLAGDDTLYGGTGSDVLDGGEGNDTLVGDGGDNDPWTGVDDDHYPGGDDKLFGGDGNDILNGFEDDDDLYGGRGDDIYQIGKGEQGPRGDRVFDVAGPEGGHDKIYTTLDAYDLAPWGKGEWVEDLQYTGTGDFVGRGNRLDNAIVGASGNDTLFGAEGNDTLVGGEGRDTLYGGIGNDTYFIDKYDTVVEETGYFDDTGFVGGGIDTVLTDRVSYNLPDHVENLVFSGASAHIGYGNAWNNIITGSGVGMLILEGRGGDDTLVGGRYNDILRGGSENDTLDGGEGHDTLTGGTGDDTYRIDGNTKWDSVTELLGEGTDTIVWTPGVQLRVPGHSLSPPHYTLGDNIENLTLDGTRRGDGTGNGADNVLVGNGAANTLRGLSGNDTLRGAGGHDTLEGGAGRDTLAGDAGDDTLRGGENDDTLNGGFSDESDSRGNDGDDTLDGGAGNDTLVVSYGSDTIDGGADTDTLSFAWVGADLNVDLGRGTTSFRESGGFVDGNSFGGWNAGVTVTWKNVENLVGGLGSDTLMGDAGDNRLTGGVGGDTFAFADGWGQDVITDFARGVDRLDLSRVTGLVRFDQLTLTSTADGAVIAFEGNTILLRGVDASALSAADLGFATPPIQAGETFDGTAHWGGALQGTGGSDTVSFAGAGHAIYVDLMRDGGYAEGLGPAHSARVSSIENITGSATMLNYLHGNEADNVLVGGDNFDWLVGRGGNNTLDGRGSINFADYYETDAPVSIDLTTGKATHSTGVDTLINIQQFRGTNSADEFRGDGQDNYFNGMNGDDTVLGGEGSDTLDGSGHDDTLEGGAGDDVLIGSSGNDVLTGGADADRFVYADAGPSHDRILDFNAAEGDRLDFRGNRGVAGFGDIRITSADGGALVTYGDNSILLEGVNPLEVNASWFLH